MSKKLQVKKWINCGEINPDAMTQDEILESCGNLLDHSCSHDIVGEAMFLATDGKYYVITVEAMITKANPAYAKDFLKRMKQEA
jgi:hypothetical protein